MPWHVSWLKPCSALFAAQFAFSVVPSIALIFVLSCPRPGMFGEEVHRLNDPIQCYVLRAEFSTF